MGHFWLVNIKPGQRIVQIRQFDHQTVEFPKFQHCFLGGTTKTLWGFLWCEKCPALLEYLLFTVSIQYNFRVRYASKQEGKYGNIQIGGEERYLCMASPCLLMWQAFQAKKLSFWNLWKTSLSHFHRLKGSKWVVKNTKQGKKIREYSVVIVLNCRGHLRGWL